MSIRPILGSLALATLVAMSAAGCAGDEQPPAQLIDGTPARRPSAAALEDIANDQIATTIKVVDTRRVVTVIARDRRHERAIRHAPDVQLVVTDAQEPARDARPLAVAGAGIGTTSDPFASAERLTLARQPRIAAREDRLVVHHAASTRQGRRSGCGSW